MVDKGRLESLGTYDRIACECLPMIARLPRNFIMTCVYVKIEIYGKAKEKTNKHPSER